MHSLPMSERHTRTIEPRESEDWRVIALILLGVLGFMSKLWYRPWVHQHGVEDFGLQGVLPSFFVAVFVVLSEAKMGAWRAALVAMAGAAVYELSQASFGGWRLPGFLGQGTFDPWDLVAAAYGATLGALLVTWRPIAEPVPDHEASRAAAVALRPCSGTRRARSASIDR